MKTLAAKSLGLAIWIYLLQIPFSLFCMLPLMQNDDLWNYFDFSFQTGASGNRINILGGLLQFGFFFLSILSYLYLLDKILKKKREEMAKP